MRFTTNQMAIAAVVGAAYAALTMALAPISYGPIQMRLSEVLCILPFFLPCTTWGLFLGCMIANLISAAGVWDVIFGSLATLCACLCIQALGQQGRGASSWQRVILAVLMPVLWNALIVGGMLTWSLTDTPLFHFSRQFWIFAGEVGLGELIAAQLLVPVAHPGGLNHLNVWQNYCPALLFSSHYDKLINWIKRGGYHAR